MVQNVVGDPDGESRKTCPTSPVIDVGVDGDLIRCTFRYGSSTREIRTSSVSPIKLRTPYTVVLLRIIRVWILGPSLTQVLRLIQGALSIRVVNVSKVRLDGRFNRPKGLVH